MVSEGSRWTSAGRWRWRRQSRTSSPATAFLFLLPALLVIGVFHLYGTGRNIYLSLTNWTLAGAEFIGLTNYIELVQGGDFWNSVKVTFFFAFVVPVTVIVAIPVAYLLHYVIRKSYLYRLLLFVPFIVPTVATSLVWGLVFAPSPTGVLNASLQPFGVRRQSWILDSTGVVELVAGWFGATVPGWAEGPSIAMAILLLVRFWQMLGFTVPHPVRGDDPYRPGPPGRGPGGRRQRTEDSSQGGDPGAVPDDPVRGGRLPGVRPARIQHDLRPDPGRPGPDDRKPCRCSCTGSSGATTCSPWERPRRPPCS